MSVFKHSDGKRWKAVLNYVDHTGKRRQIARLADTLKEANRYAREFENRRDANDLPSMVPPVTPTPGVPTLNAYAESWITNRRRPGKDQIRHSTEARYRVGLRRVTDRLGALTLDAIDPEMIEGVYDSLRAAGLAEASIWVSHQSLGAVLKTAAAGRSPLIVFNPMTEVKNAPGKSDGQQIDVLEASEVERLIEATDAYDYGYVPYPALIRFLAWTGARLGEALALRWDDVDLDGKRITIRASMNKFREVTETKTKAVRRISISCPLTEVLRGVLERQLIARMETDHYRNDGFVFANKIGEPMTQSMVESAWIKIRKTAGSTAKLHGFRHAHASALISAGIPITKVAERLGHKDVNTTLRVYAHAMPSDDDRVMDAMDGIYSGK